MINLGKLKDIKVLGAIIVFIFICFLVLAGCKNLLAKNMKLGKDITKRSQELDNERNTLARQGPMKSELNKVSSKILSIEERFSSNVEEIFLQLNKFAAESGVSLKTISPTEKKIIGIPNTKDTYIVLPVTIKLKCNYHELVVFLRRIENANKIIAVTDIRIQPNQQDIWKHDIELIVNIPVTI